MKRTLIILLLFYWAVNVFSMDYARWFEKYKDIMINEEIERWGFLKDDFQKEQFIKQFWRARDFNQFTERNEFREIYQKRLEFADTHFSNHRDPRRIVFLLLGPPRERRTYPRDILNLDYPLEEKIRIGQGEIWKYTSEKNTSFFIIFAKINPFFLEGLQSSQRIWNIRTESINYEILYIGPKGYSSIKEFIREVVLGRRITESTEKTISQLKESFIFNRVRKFYQTKIDNYFVEERAQFRKALKIKKAFIQRYIVPDTINRKDIVGIGIFLSFPSSILAENKNEKELEYIAELSLLVRIKNKQGQVVIYHQKEIGYRLKKRLDFVYACWGSISPGKYELILEIVDKRQKAYRRIEKEINLGFWQRKRLSGFVLIGKRAGSPEQIKESSGPISFRRIGFFPVISDLDSNFNKDESLLVLIYLKNFCFNSYKEIKFAVFLEIEGKRQVYSFLLDKFEGKVEDNFCYKKFLEKRIGDLIKNIDIDGLIKIGIKAVDLIGNEEIGMVYIYPISVFY